ncbi:hypothetical protein ACLE0F_002256 [Cronobacter sakazakii]
MKLIDLLVQELPKRGGWPEGINVIEQNFHGKLFNGSKPYRPFLFDDEKFEIVDEWREARVTREQYEAALAAAQQPVWDGEGLPPVGCECEFFDCEKWFKVTMMYGGSQLVVLYDHDNQIERSFSTSRIDGKFRPICSEADKKRDEVGLAIYHAINWNSEGELVSPKRMEDYKKAYDAIAAGNIPHIRIE